MKGPLVKACGPGEGEVKGCWGTWTTASAGSLHHLRLSRSRSGWLLCSVGTSCGEATCRSRPGGGLQPLQNPVLKQEGAGNKHPPLSLPSCFLPVSSSQWLFELSGKLTSRESLGYSIPWSQPGRQDQAEKVKGWAWGKQRETIRSLNWGFPRGVL